MKSYLHYAGNFWRWVAGDSVQSLDKCSSKARIRSAACGMMLPVAAAVAGGGMAYTAWLLTASRLWAGGLGLVWAMAIFVIDRAIVATVVPGRGNFFRLIPRVLLTVVGSLIFAHALLFWFFGPALDRHMAADARGEAEAAMAKIAPDLEAARQRHESDITKWENRLTGLDQQAAANSEEQQQKRQELTKWRALLDDEKEGRRASGKPKAGPEYERTKADFISPVQSDLDRLVHDLEAIVALQKDAQNALSKAMEALHNGPEIAALRQRLDTEYHKIVAQNLRDFYSRLKALHALVGNDTWNLAGYIVCCLFLTFLELSAVVIKLSGGKDDYTVHLHKEQFRAEEDFENFRQIYPAVSAERIESDLELETKKHHLDTQLEFAMDKVRMVRVLAQSIHAEKEQMFQVVDQLLEGCSRNGGTREEENVELQRLADSMLRRFITSAEHSMEIFTQNARASADAKQQVC